MENDSSSQASSKESYNRPNGYQFQDDDNLKRVILACAVCKGCFQGILQLFEKVSGCGLARTLVLQYSNNREFKQITTAGATTAAVTEKVWGEYVSVVCQILSLILSLLCGFSYDDNWGINIEKNDKWEALISILVEKKINR